MNDFTLAGLWRTCQAIGAPLGMMAQSIQY